MHFAATEKSFFPAFTTEPIRTSEHKLKLMPSNAIISTKYQFVNTLSSLKIKSKTQPAVLCLLEGGWATVEAREEIGDSEGEYPAPGGAATPLG